MAKKFEVGKTYEANERDYEPITIIRRTDKTVWVKNSNCAWMMRIWLDGDGNECVTDSTVPKKWRVAFTYSAKWEQE